MRHLNRLAAGAICAGLGLGAAAAQAPVSLKISAAPVTTASNQEDYRMGFGGTAAVSMEGAMGAATDTRLGIRGTISDYRNEEGTSRPDYQEYGIALEGLIGPAAMIFEPKVGGHVGYVRVDGDPGTRGEDLLDVGADVLATFNVLPNLGLQAQVTPTWLLDDEDADYETRAAVGLQLSIPGA